MMKTPKGMRAVKIYVVDETFKRARLEQIADDPECWHVWWRGKILYGPMDQSEAEACYADLLLEKYGLSRFEAQKAAA